MWLTLAVTSLVVIAFLVPLLSLVRDVAASRETIEATVEAQSAAALVNVDDASLALILQQLNAGSSRRTSVFTAAGVRGAAAERDAAVDSVFTAPTAVTVDVPGGRAVLVPVLGADQRTSAVVRTFIPADALRGGVGTAWLALVLLGLALLAAAGGLAWLLGRSLVRPLLSVAGTADALRAGDLTARAEPAEPAEVRRIAEALNGLADRIADLLQAEREAAADLSHRLRTPLTALRLDAEGLRDEEEADRVLGAVDSLERMVSHVIASARRAPTVGAVADAAAVVRERVEFWSVLAEEQDRPVRVELPAGSVPVPVAADERAAAVDALLGNVFAHTPVGTGFAVAVRPGAGAGGGGRGRRPGHRGAGAARPGPVRRFLHRARAGHRPPYGGGDRRPARPGRCDAVRAAGGGLAGTGAGLSTPEGPVRSGPALGGACGWGSVVGAVAPGAAVVRTAVVGAAAVAAVVVHRLPGPAAPVVPRLRAAAAPIVTRLRGALGTVVARLHGPAPVVAGLGRGAGAGGRRHRAGRRHPAPRVVRPARRRDPGPSPPSSATAPNPTTHIFTFCIVPTSPSCSC